MKNHSSMTKATVGADGSLRYGPFFGVARGHPREGPTRLLLGKLDVSW